MTFRDRLYLHTYRTREKCRRIARAWRYLWGRSTIGDAWKLYHECEDIHGFHAIEGISESTLRDWASDDFSDRPELDSIVARACNRVQSKWDGGTNSGAEDWAMDLIKEYAAEAGIFATETADAAP